MTAEERAGWLAGLQQLANAVQAAFSTVLADFDAYGDGQTLHGARSTASWLRAQLGLAPGDAGQQMRVARGSRGLLAEPLAALAAGEVTWDQVRAVEHTVNRLADPTLAPEAVDLLTGLARSTDVMAVRRAGDRLRHVVDPDATCHSVEQDFARRRLTMSPLLDGMVALDGLLDAEAAALLDGALAPFLVPAGSDDTRTTPQRRADGLVDLVQAAVSGGSARSSGGAPANLQILVGWETMAGRSGEPAAMPDHPGRLGHLTMDALARLSCDPVLTPILLSSRGVPMMLGRSSRRFTDAQRRLMAVRDGGCRWPGCGRPARHTEGHHRIPWLDGGTTDPVNGLLLCRYHHRKCHGGRWRITPEDEQLGANGRLWFHPPAGAAALLSDPRAP